MFADVPQPHSMTRNAKNYAAEGYAGNDTLFKCITYLVQNAAAIPPKLYTDATMQSEITSHPLLDKLARPNVEQDGVTYREAVLGWYFITGNSFQYAIRSGTSGPPDELWVLEATKVKPLPTKTRGISGYKFDDFEDSQNPIAPQNIGHLRTWNPTDPIFGLSPIEVGGLLVDQQTAARKWNLALLQNMAKPPGAWVTEQMLSANDRSKLETRINEKMNGARNAGRAPVLDGALKWQSIMTNPSELDWLKSLQYNAGQLANLYNMPPQLIGDTSATTYNNMQEAKSASYTEAIFPALDKLYALWRMWLLPMYPDLCDKAGNATAYLYYDKLTVEVVQQALQLRESAKVERATKIFLAAGCDLYTYQEMCDLKPDENGKGIYRVANLLIPADKLKEYAEQALTSPAEPPLPLPEPLGDDPAQPGGNAHNNTPPEPQPAKARFTPQEKAALIAVRERLRHQRKKLAPATHKTWECAPGACSFCLQNDGVTVGIDEEFPNGCETPDDCHKYCYCSMYTLALPDDLDPDEQTPGFLIAAYGVGYQEPRHYRDVEARDAAKPAPLPKPVAVSSGYDPNELAYAGVEKRARREEYRDFIREVVLS